MLPWAVVLSASVVLHTCGPSLAADRKITVSPDGTGDFRTVQEAFAAVPDRSPDRTIIHLKPGTYEGQKILPASKSGVWLEGEDAAKTILTFTHNTNEEQPAGVNLRYKGTGVVILGKDFHADRLTFQNTSGDHGQALALRIDGDRAVVTNCRILGWQDTLMVNNGRQYFKDCTIEGRVDFIYGSGTTVFDHCRIHSKNGGHVTAASTPQDHPYGFVFLDCKLTGDPRPWVDPTGQLPTRKAKTPPLADLGRPWRPYASVTYLNCEMGNHILPAGWNNWRNPANEKTARYAEYNSHGPGANPARRVPWSRQLTREEADRITVETVLGGNDHWKPR
jgi:pectinesterase